MKLAVIGSKDFADYDFLKSILDKENEIDRIISGGAKGADSLAKKYALEKNIEFLEFPPNHIKHGNEAKHFRDREIVENCDKVIAFYDEKCEGTKYTIDFAKQKQKPVKVILYKLFES
ncbi:MAG: DUF2493 domain-containing protein [Candidatus Cloacimonetes bacterium]|nr:DUF2493 domain-containing protein [Candidatus Cloacimonadota bacterium]